MASRLQLEIDLQKIARNMAEISYPLLQRKD